MPRVGYKKVGVFAAQTTKRSDYDGARPSKIDRTTPPKSGLAYFNVA
jgi:hypothetical protein